MSHHGKFWLDLHGTLIPVPESQSHEEWANQLGHDLEELQALGWVRIQNVPPPYLLIDFQVHLNAAQAVAVAGLFGNRFERVVVEFRGEAREFMYGEEAMASVMRIE